MGACDHPRDQWRPFAREVGRPQVYECFACGALIEERPPLEGIGFECIVVQEGASRRGSTTMGEAHDLYGRWDPEGAGDVRWWDVDVPGDYAGIQTGELARLEARHAAGEWLPVAEFEVISRARQAAVHRALRSGRLQKEPCAVCGVTDGVQAHHHSYLREDALDVTWLCWRCHFLQRHGVPFKATRRPSRRGRASRSS